MSLFFEVLLEQRTDNLVRGLGSHFFLEVLDQAVRAQGVGDGSVELEIDADADAVGGHQGGVFFHLLGRVVVFGCLVPGMCTV